MCRFCKATFQLKVHLKLHINKVSAASGRALRASKTAPSQGRTLKQPTLVTSEIFKRNQTSWVSEI